MFPYILETSSLYSSRSEYFVVKVTEVSIQNKVKETSEKNDNTGLFTLKGKRLDAAATVYTIIVPITSEIPHIEIGEFVIAKYLEKDGYGLYVGKLYSKIYEDDTIDQLQQGDRFLLPYFQDRPVSGKIYNENIIYLTYYSEYINRRQQDSEYVYNRVIKFPSYSIYKRYFDLFDYDKEIEKILDDTGAEERTKRFIFEHAENPLSESRKDLTLLNSYTDDFIYRPDPIIDSLLQPENQLLLEKDTGIKLFENHSYTETDVYPYPFILDEIDFKNISYDEIINSNLKDINKIYYQKEFRSDSTLVPDFSTEVSTPFFPKEFYEIKIGRNRFSINKLDYEDKHSFILLKSQSDQSLSFLTDTREKDIYSFRIRNKKATFIIDEIDNYSRVLLSSSINQQIEIFDRTNNNNFINILSSIDTELKKLKDKTRPTRYSNLQLGTKQYNNTLARSSLGHINTNNYNTFSSDLQYLFATTQISDNNYSDFYLLSDSSRSTFLTYQQLGSKNAYIGIEVDFSDEVIELKTSSNISIKLNNDAVTVIAGTTRLTVNKNGNVVTVAGSTDLKVVKDGNVTTNEAFEATKHVKGSKFIGNLVCTGTVIPGNPGSISVQCS